MPTQALARPLALQRFRSRSNGIAVNNTLSYFGIPLFFFAVEKFSSTNFSVAQTRLQLTLWNLIVFR
jgi:hypothetical protein